MALQYSAAVAAAKLNVVESTIGVSAIMRVFAGAVPANLATAAGTGTAILATLTLPSDWMAAATTTGSAQVAKLGTWQDASADNTGTAAYFRIYASGGADPANAHIQGTVGTSGADMIVDSTSFTAGQSFTVNTFTITGGNYP